MTYAQRLDQIKWGSAEQIDSRDRTDVALFLDRLSTEPGLTAKGMIVADHAGMGRWEMLGTLISISTPEALELGLTDDGVWTLERALLDLVCDELLEAFGDPATVSYSILADNRVTWLRGRLMLRPSVVNTLPHLAQQSEFVTPIVLRHLLWQLASPWSPSRGRPNPFDLLMSVYERGVLVDFVKWKFTNTRQQDLGPLPEAPLETAT